MKRVIVNRDLRPDPVHPLHGPPGTVQVFDIDWGAMPESTHRLTLQLHVDDAMLEAHRARYIADNPEDEDLAGFYGRPDEWKSILDIIDAHEAAVILRSEVVDNRKVAAHDPYPKARRDFGRVGRRHVFALAVIVGLALLLVLSSVARSHTVAIDGRTWDVPVIYPGHRDTDLVLGSRFGDTVGGRRGPDDLSGLRGADELSGGAGRDRLVGGRNADFLKGGDGDDILLGGAGPDVLVGGPGLDICVGGYGLDLTIGCERFALRR